MKRINLFILFIRAPKYIKQTPQVFKGKSRQI